MCNPTRNDWLSIEKRKPEIKAEENEISNETLKDSFFVDWIASIKENGIKKVFIKLTAPCFWELWGENSLGDVVTEIFFSEESIVEQVVNLSFNDDSSDKRVVIKSRGVKHIFAP